MKYYVDTRTFSQILLFALAPCAEVSASEISREITHIYSAGGHATGSRQTTNAATPWYKILNSGGVVSNTKKFNELGGSQLSTQNDRSSIKYIDQITSVLDATGLEHFKQCATYLNEDDMGITNIKLKAELLQSLQTRQERDFTEKRPSQYACTELFTLFLN